MLAKANRPTPVLGSRRLHLAANSPWSGVVGAWCKTFSLSTEAESGTVDTTEGVHHTSTSTFKNPRTKFPPWWGQSSKSDSDLRDNICVYEDCHPSQMALVVATVAFGESLLRPKSSF